MSVHDVYLLSSLAPASISCNVSMVALTPDIISFAGEFSFLSFREIIHMEMVCTQAFICIWLTSLERRRKRQKKQSFVLCHPSTSCARFQPKSTLLFCLPLVCPVLQNVYWVKWIWCSSLSHRLILSVRKDQENINKTPYYFLVTSIWVMISMLL